jgi:hypothetical protein
MLFLLLISDREGDGEVFCRLENPPTIHRPVCVDGNHDNHECHILDAYDIAHSISGKMFVVTSIIEDEEIRYCNICIYFYFFGMFSCIMVSR